MQEVQVKEQCKSCEVQKVRVDVYETEEQGPSREEVRIAELIIS
jgi:hypothetical protein